MSEGGPFPRQKVFSPMGSRFLCPNPPGLVRKRRWDAGCPHRGLERMEKSDFRHHSTEYRPGLECAGGLYPFLRSMSNLPPRIASDLIRENSQENAIILDPSSSCGVVAIEALRLGLRAVAIERNPVTAFWTEVLLRPISLPLLQWGFEDVRAACREGLSSLFGTACWKCGNQALIERVHRENGKPVRIEYACACTRKRRMKKPDADDLLSEERIAGLEIPFWHPVLHLSQEDAAARYPQDFINRRTVAGLSIILHAIEGVGESSARDALKAAFASALDASGRRELPSPSESIGKRRRAEIQPEENPWLAFEAGFRKLYEAKKETNRILKDAAIGRSFAELASGRANVLILVGTSKEPPADELTEGSIDGVVTAAPSDLSGRELPLRAIQAAWLKMDWAQDAEKTTTGERISAAFRSIRRAAKPGSRAHIFCGDDGNPNLHGLLNILEKIGLPIEQISFQPAPDRRGTRGGYILRSQIQKTESILPIKAAEASLRRKLADTARSRFALYGPKIPAEKILHAFYQQLEAKEIASVSKYSIDDLLAKAVEPFARYRNGKLTLVKGKSRSIGRGILPEAWRRIVLDAESLAAGGREECRIARGAAARRLAGEGLSAEDTDALRGMMREADIDRHRRERTTSLLRDWGKALGFPTRLLKGSTRTILWKTAADRTVEFTLGKQGILIASTRKGGTVSHWGSLSYLNLERRLLDWCRSHPEEGKNLSRQLMPPEIIPDIGDDEPQEKRLPVRDLKLKVIQNRKVCDRHYLISLAFPARAGLDLISGQFFHILCDPAAEKKRPYPLTLRRPLSIHRLQYTGFDPAALAWVRDIPEEIRYALVRRPVRLEFLYRVVGEGTELLSHARRGMVLDAIGPCGNGFTIGDERTAVIVAGGIGIAPLAALAEQLRYFGKDVLVYIGAVEKEMLNLAVTRNGGSGNADRELLDAVESEFREIGAKIMTVCTDDGSAGEKGLVTGMLERGILEGCIPRESVRLYACGPEGMLREVAGIAARHSLDCEVSLEERMACGIGACYSCTTTVMLPDGTTRKKRVCREGPVFQARDIVWKD
jgi:dihydroorotate dehydrogenase electron transfer subunit